MLSNRSLQGKFIEKLEQKEREGYQLLQQQAAWNQQFSSPHQQPHLQNQAQYYQYPQQPPYQQQNVMGYHQPQQYPQLAYQPPPVAPQMGYPQLAYLSPPLQGYPQMMAPPQLNLGYQTQPLQYLPAAQHLQHPQQVSGMGYLPPPPPQAPTQVD